MHTRYRLPRTLSEKLRKLAVLTTALSGILLCSAPAKAQVTDFTLGISPPTAYIQIKPGEYFDHQISVDNRSIYTLAVTPELTEFKPKEDGTVELKKKAPFPKVQVEFRTEGIELTQPFTLKPGEQKNIRVRLAAPFASEEMEHHLTFLFTGNQAIPGLAVAQSGTAISGGVASNVVLLVSPQTANQGRLQIADLQAPQVIDSFGTLPFAVTVRNQGTNATQIVGKVTVSNRSNPSLKEYILYPDMVLADGQRRARGTTEAELEQALLALESSQATASDSDEGLDYSKLQSLSDKFYFDAPFMFGLYTITAAIGGETHSVTVFALPISILVSLLIVVIIAATYLLLRRSLSLKHSAKIQPRENDAN